MKRILLALLVAVSCGKPPEVDSDLRAYFDRFERYSEEAGRGTGGDERLPISFARLGGKTAGLCETDFWSGDEVKINSALWSEMSDLQKEGLILHELGHCLLGRDHLNSRITVDGRTIPESIMNEELLSSQVYKGEKAYYISELFHSGYAHKCENSHCVESSKFP